MHSPLASAVWEGYRIPGIGSSMLGTGLAGIAGAMFVFVVSWLLGGWIAPAIPPRPPGALAEGERTG